MFDWSDVTRRFKDLASLIDTKPVFRWGIITNADPLLVQLDGDDRPIAGSPSTIIGGLAPGERVLCLVQNRRVTVTGRGGGSKQKVLWSDPSGKFLNGAPDNVINLSEPVSAQPNGIIMVWSRYESGAPVNGNFNYIYVPKAVVDGTIHTGGWGMNQLLADANTLFRKYVYVSDNTIEGLTANGTAPGNTQVVRWVLGY